MLFVLIIFLGSWLGSVLLWWLITGLFRSVDADRVKSRILENPEKKKAKGGQASSPALLNSQAEDKGAGEFVLNLLKKFQIRQKLQEILEQAGMKWKPARLVQVSLLMFGIGFFFSRLLLPPQWQILTLAVGAATAALPLFHVVRLRRKRMFRFEELFPESLEFMARSMRAGHAFSVSLEMIHREFQEPLSGEFRRTFDEHNLGMQLDMALLKLSKRVPLLDVHFFVSAILLQKRTGGNLAEILDKLAYVIRERFKLRGKIRAISAHGRMTGLALTCIPIAVAVLMFYVNPEYVKFFFNDSTGNIMMGAAIGLQIIGYLIIRKIVTIEV